VRDLADRGDDTHQVEEEEEEEDENDDESEEELEVQPKVKAYNALLQSFSHADSSGEHKAKRRKLVDDREIEVDEAGIEPDVDGSSDSGAEEHSEDSDAEDEVEEEENADGNDPYEVHFANPDDNELSRRLKSVQGGEWRTEKQALGKAANMIVSIPRCVDSSPLRKKLPTSAAELPLKERLAKDASGTVSLDTEVEQNIASLMFSYNDLLVANRTPQNAGDMRNMACLHAVNHVLKGRDKVIKNNERLRHAAITGSQDDVDCRDQGFVRPKVLILLETRQMAVSYANAIVSMFAPEQQENRKRFDDAFTAPIDEASTMPADYQELFAGNNDNSFLTALKFTRKTLKFYSAFYASDIILASPLGLRRVVEHEDVKKRDHDFLSSIELVIADQVDAMCQQNWTNVTTVFTNLNLPLKESHDCDFSRVRSWYLDNHASSLRQTVLLTAYITPEILSLYNSLTPVSAKAKITPPQSGVLAMGSSLGIKQTFSRFPSPTPAADPDARFKYFTTAILPSLLRLPRPADNAPGILVFIPTYFDFLRVRNFFATSPLTENIAFGAIHDYSAVSDQRRARSHFLSGRFTVLLYTQRAHHFFRLKIRGVKRVVFYGLPDAPVYYDEVVGGFLGSSINDGKIIPEEAKVRSVFGRWDGLRLERVVGTERVKGLLQEGAGDTFDFV
jgi:U3 small nucleolar RNA-associated protein 25